MRKVVASIVAANFLVAPVHAADWHDQTTDIREGAFVGARLKISLGASRKAKPQAELAIAPTQSRISDHGFVRTSIGEGVALRLSPKAKPSLTLAGVPVNSALGLKPQGEVDADHKLGISTAGYIAIGVGVAALVGGFIFYQDFKDGSLSDCCE